MSDSIDILDTPNKNVTTNLAKQILGAVGNIRWGSVEIFIQDNKVTQITERNITKPNHDESHNNHGIQHTNGKMPS